MIARHRAVLAPDRPVLEVWETPRGPHGRAAGVRRKRGADSLRRPRLAAPLCNHHEAIDSNRDE